MLQKLKNLIREVSWRVRAARGASVPELSLVGTTLIIAPHPDDEALGCGGLIARLVSQGNAPHVAILSGGGASLRSRADFAPEVVMAARRRLTLDSARGLGLPGENIHFLNFEDGAISARPEDEMDRLRQLVTQLQPRNLLVPHRGEGWPDHLAVREIGIELSREAATGDVEVREYCVWMWYYNVYNLDWDNARVLRMTPAEYAAKLRAVRAYVEPTAPDGSPWSGVLPAPFLHANTSRHEFYFRVETGRTGRASLHRL